MKHHWRNLKYIVRHRWFVMIECWKKGLYWQGIVHDLSKFGRQEWGPYARHFFLDSKTPDKGRDKTGYYKPTDTGDPAFDLAWLHHANHNPHHWQYWTQVTDDGTVKAYDMPWRYRLEMLCDWAGAHRAQRTEGLVGDWYRKNGRKIVLHQRTREMIERELFGVVYLSAIGGALHGGEKEV